MFLNRYFIKYYFKYSSYFFAGVLILICINWIQLEIPEYVGNIIKTLQNSVNLDLDKNIVYDNIVKILITVLIIAISRVCWRFLLFATARKIQQDIRNELFTHATSLSQNYYSKNKVGKIMSYFNQDLEQITRSYSVILLYLTDIIFLGSFAIYKVFNKSWFVGLWVILPLSLIGVLGYYFHKVEIKKVDKMMKSYEELNEFTQESFSGNYVVKAFVRNENEANIFLNKIKIYKKNLMSFVKTLYINNVIFTFIRNVLFISVIISVTISVGTKSDIIPSLEPTDLLIIILYITTLTWPLNAVTLLISTISRSKSSGKRVLEFLNTKTDIFDNDISNNIDYDNFKAEIEFKNLSFKYPDEITNKQALHNISFKINEGEMVGILGKTGSGKTTIVDLLLRLYNVENNKILINNIDIMKYPIKKIRELIAYVPQDNFLFTDTITNNIAFSYPFRHKRLVEESSKIASVYSNIIDFPDKFETELGERGVTLSGGQKQRISLARALLRDSKILILDDSVSALDTKTETEILKNLKENRKNQTTILITHRISTMEKMDKVILVDDGKILQVGTHNELLKTNKVYQNLYILQQLEKEKD